MEDRHFHELLQDFDLSRSGYRKVRKGVKKRIGRHMKALGCRQMADYLFELGMNPGSRVECERLLTVPISRFFREREFWLRLEKALPDLAADAPCLNVWSAGCAGGEEAYTFKIIWERALKNGEISAALHLLATDINPEVLKRAEEGVYPKSSFKSTPAEIRDAHFTPGAGGRGWKIRSHLKKDILWKRHHLLDEPPGDGFHLIFLRNNLLTYYQESSITPALEKIIASLSPAGLLIVGSNENPPAVTTGLHRLDFCPHAFFKHEKLNTQLPGRIYEV
ncbi:MAG: hypothetical protein GY859_22560 [Desulfobacterales bacterium]|nr:hypothetical protein [Desulfobacterales bacterium]